MATQKAPTLSARDTNINAQKTRSASLQTSRFGGGSERRSEIGASDEDGRGSSASSTSFDSFDSFSSANSRNPVDIERVDGHGRRAFFSTSGARRATQPSPGFLVRS